MALTAYYWASQPWRVCRRAELERQGQIPLCVLFYHRVADRFPNGWSIGRSAFQRQMEWMAARFDLVSLDEIQQRMRQGNNRRMAVSITFDDGYAENCDWALPYLLEHQIPVTYFVALDYVLRQRPFPHDRQAGRPLPPNTLEQLQWMARAGVTIGAHTRTHCDLGQVTDAAALYDELVAARDELAAAIGQPVEYFSFPYGLPANLNPTAVALARASGLRGVCSAFGAYNLPGADPYHIRRIHGDCQFARLKNWLSIDPRKLRRGQEIDILAAGEPVLPVA